ncbi:MAG TPA: hypothetical protein VGB85_24740 [Nannocystis sp.]|jgi:hypothetical protein
MHTQLHEFFCAAFSAQQFRRWVRRLAPGGRGLAQALPGDDIDTLTLFDRGIDLLIRHNYIDATFFVELAREFPKRHAELAELARKCGVPWTASGSSTLSASFTSSIPHPRRGLPGAAIAAGACLAVGLIGYLRAASLAGPPPISTIRSIESDPVMPSSGVWVPWQSAPATSTVLAKTTGPGGSHGGKRHGHAVEISAVVEQEKTGPASEPATTKPARVACALPGSLRAELQALAEVTLRRPGLSEEFTVLLMSTASIPQVSPSPGAGNATARKLYQGLVSLGPAQLGQCRDTKIDVVFSAYKTTVEPRI